MSFTFGANGTTHIGQYFYSLWGWPYGQYLAGVLDAAIFFGPKVSWALHWRMWCEGTHAQNYTKPPRKPTMHHLSRCISHWTMMIFQCNVSFQGVHGSKAFKTVAMAMLVIFARVTFVWIGSVFLLLTVPKPVLLRFFVMLKASSAEKLSCMKHGWTIHQSTNPSIPIHPFLSPFSIYLYYI